MSNDVGRLIRRSARAVQRLALNTADRLEAARTAVATGAYDANHLARDVAGQTLDTLNVWLETLRFPSDTTPAVLIEIVVTGRGTAKVYGAATVTLREPIPSLSLLKKTGLSSPRGTIAAKQIDLSNVGDNSQVEVLMIRVTVPNGQKQGLYQGLITIGAVVQVELRAWIHT